MDKNEKKKKLGQALRENLIKRKQQQRVRSENSDNKRSVVTSFDNEKEEEKTNNG